MRRLRALALVLFLPTTAVAREAEPQQHEVRVDVEMQIETQANGAFVTGQYTWTPRALNRVDEVVPILRRFVRHPSELWIRIGRNGNTREQITGARAGGVLQLVDGRLYAGGEIGIEYDTPTYDPNERGYFGMPFDLEVGGRPHQLFSIGGFFGGRAIIGNTTFANRDTQAERSGIERRFGVRMSAATPNDRIYGSLALFYGAHDWTFEGFHPGDLTAKGPGALLRVAFQLTTNFSLQLRGQTRLESWDNERASDGLPSFVGEELERTVLYAYGNADIIYWYRGRYAFRFGVGGGFEGAPPVINNRETGVFQIGLGLITRF